ncbi:MAG: hypothetical protein IT427_05305 [Pirellulales bacterium]|nr:hypothetical protein [Pirellulales bacterium]
MRNFSKALSRTLRIEQLETRTLMASNVTAAINTAGDLEIRGNSQSNVVAVTQFNSGVWKVAGLLGTTINGKHSEKFEYISGMNVSLGRGNDGLAIVKGNLDGALNVRTSSGFDGVAITRFTACSIYVSTGADTDAVLLADVTLQIPDMESDFAAQTQGEFGTAIFNTGSGDDYVLLAKLTAPDVCVYTNGGRDIVGLLGVDACDSLSVNMGDGNLDILAVAYSSTPVANLSGGGNPVDSYLHARNSFEEENVTGFQFTQSFDAYADQLETLVETYLPLVQQLPGLGGLPNLGSF